MELKIAFRSKWLDKRLWKRNRDIHDRRFLFLREATENSTLKVSIIPSPLGLELCRFFKILPIEKIFRENTITHDNSIPNVLEDEYIACKWGKGCILRFVYSLNMGRITYLSQRIEEVRRILPEASYIIMVCRPIQLPYKKALEKSGGKVFSLNEYDSSYEALYHFSQYLE